MGKREKVIKLVMITVIAIAILGIIILLIKGINREVVFKFKSNSVEIKVGEKLPIEYELSDNLDIYWESENPNIASVDNEGNVTGISLGSTVIKATVTKSNHEVTTICYISTYYGDKNISLNEIVIPEGELFISQGDSYQVPIEYNPQDGYINSINYEVIDTNIVDFDGTVHAKNIGTTNINIRINQQIMKTIMVNVVSEKIEPTFSKSIENINISDESIILKPGETKKIEYSIEPKQAFIKNIKWESSNLNIVDVLDGIITAKSSGEAVVKLTINNTYVKEIKVSVSVPVSKIELKSSSKVTLKIGGQSAIKVEVSPANATNKNLKYKSSNVSSLRVDQNGVMTALGAGSGNVTITSEDGNYEKVISFTVNPLKGIVSGNGGIWGYTSSEVKKPVKADLNFFARLASNGTGTLSGTTFTYSSAQYKYTYEISSGLLRVNGKAIYMRFYYPQDTDLSSVNTFTLLGGGGERSFGGYFAAIEKDTSQIKSSGIIILVSAKSSYSESDAVYSTDFVTSIVKQKVEAKNAVGGYSMSGPAAGAAAINKMYDRLIIFDSYFNSHDGIVNKEIIIYSPVKDLLIDNTITTLNRMTQANYTNVTIVSNNSQIVNKYSKYYLVINPGSPMGSGHGYANITNANVFAYACS